MTHPLTAALRMAAFVFLIVASWWAAPAGAQSSVGAGPLTSPLPETEPTGSVLAFGPLKVAPGIQVKEIGYDTNVFYEAEDPKEDWMLSAMPDVQIFSRLRLLRIAAYAGVDFTYYNTYDSERSVSDQYRGRVDFLFSKIRPFLGGGYVTQRTKPNGEINVRADRLETEFSGGAAFDLSSTSRFYGSAARLTTEFRSTADYEDVALDQALNHNTYTYSGGLEMALTPLTSLTVSGSVIQDRFRASPDRDADSREVDAEFSFAPAAIIRGSARFGFRDFRPDDPAIDPYTGLVMAVGLAVPVVDIGRFNFGVVRDTQYPFEEAEAYYVENSFEASYTHLIFGDFDVQVRGGWSSFDYGNREGQAERNDTLTTWGAGVGYNLQNRTRMAVQFEDAQRRSPELAERNYNRRRVYFSWTFAF